MKVIVTLIGLLICNVSLAYLTPLTTIISGQGLFPNGTVSAPSVSFVNSPNAGMYRIGADDIGIAVAGINGIEMTKASGSFVNLGMGGPASLSNAFPVYVNRTIDGPSEILLENGNSNPGDGVKYEMRSNGGSSVFETGQFALATSSPDAYAGGRSTVRASGTSPGISFIAEPTGANQKFYAGGNGATDQVMVVQPTGLQLTTQNAKPSCAVGLRGLLYYTQSGTGVPDQLEMCMKGTADTYAWVVVKVAL